MATMATSPDATPAERLAALVRQRRVELNMHKIDAARAAGITITTYMKVEAGESVRDVTYAKIEQALGWVPGSCRDILAGAKAASTVQPGSDGTVIASVPAEALEEEIRQAVQNVMVAGTNLTAGEIREINKRMIEELQKRGLLPGE